MSLSLFVFSLVLHHSSVHSPARAAGSTAGFSVELIHGDSPLSPFYNASQTMLDRNLAALDRSTSRASYLSRRLLNSSSVNPELVIIPYGMEYLMPLSIGTPPLKFLATMDTSTSLIWTRSPSWRTSSSYRQLSCQSKPCSSLPQKSCGKKRECAFRYSYDDHEGRPYSDGVLATDAFTIDSTDNNASISTPEVAFGGNGSSDRGGHNGVSIALVGLSPGPLSLASQLASSTHARFSYCLVPRSESRPTSVLSFGDKALIAGKDVLSTPINITAGGSQPLHLLTLQGVGLGNIHFSVWPPSNKLGRTIIDPGTLFTYLPDEFLHDFTEELADVLAAAGSDPAGIQWGPLHVCYMSNRESELSGAEITLSFEGANMTVGKTQTFIQVTEDVACLAWLPSGDPQLAILGSLVQQDFHIGYDLNHKELSFAPAQCAKL